MESNHKIEESIKAIRGSQRVKEIALLLHEKTVLNSDEFADLFDGLMQLMGYKEKFQIVNCFEVLQEFIG